MAAPSSPRCENPHARFFRPRLRHLALHAGAAPDPATGARAVPIHLSTSFVFESSEHAASLFNMERSGHVYSRISNPTNAVLEERMAALEGGSGAIATASGQAALHLAIATLAGAGSHIVASSALYGGIHNLLHYTLARFGIEHHLRQAARHRRLARRHPAQHPAAVRRNPGQPRPGRAGHPHRQRHRPRRGLPLLVDSTFTTPWLMKPFDHGADLIYHSATKFLCGHGTVIGGVLVDSGRFDWDASGRFPELSEPYAGFHGMVFSEESTRRRVPAAGAPRGPARLRRLHEPAHRVADPAGHRDAAAAHGAACGQHAQGGGLPGRTPDGGSVGYPELDGHPSQALAKKLLPRGCGSVFSFDLKGTRKQGQAFIEALKMFSHLANVGDCRSLVIHPASTTHFRMDDAALAPAGIPPGTIRLASGWKTPTT